MANRIVAIAEKLYKAEIHNPVVARTIHTAWQAALGAVVASLTGTHGDVRVALMVGVAAAAAAVKNEIFVNVVHVPSTTPPVVVPSTPASQPVAAVEPPVAS